MCRLQVCVFMMTSFWSWVVATVVVERRRVLVVRTFGFEWFRKQILFLWFLRRAELGLFCPRVHRPQQARVTAGLPVRSNCATRTVGRRPSAPPASKAWSG